MPLNCVAKINDSSLQQTRYILIVMSGTHAKAVPSLCANAGPIGMLSGPRGSWPGLSVVASVASGVLSARFYIRQATVRAAQRTWATGRVSVRRPISRM